MSLLAAPPSTPRASVLAIAATFTAEPLAEPLGVWLDEARLAMAPAFAPFDQLHRQLLDPDEEFARNAGGVNVLLVRLQDWARSGDEAQVDERLRALEGALRAYEMKAPLLVIRCPDAPARERAGEAAAEWERRLAGACDPRRGVHAVPISDLLRLMKGADYSSAHGERLGQIPYTEGFFAALAGIIVRRAAALQPSPYKVIAVDCDGTLWSGVCAEVGPWMVEVPPAFLAVQRFLVEQVERGRIVCLCSKNEPHDVWEVFRYRAGMPLTRNRVAASRINWETKSSNLRSLAEELNVGLDSFIFLDDNPAERAEVRAHAPEVLTLELPDDPVARPGFLDGTWAFDHLLTTDYDRKRGAFYLEEGRRREARAGTVAFQDFLDALDLAVDVEDLDEDALERVAQLSQRTNQFNTTGLRLTPAELRDWVSQDGRVGRTVRARDRFGDYGLIGAVLGEERGDAFHVAALLLSCRALGRGVEYRTLNALGAYAEERGMRNVEFAFTPMARNTPARQFLETVALARESGAYALPAADAVARRYEPGEPEPAPDDGSADEPGTEGEDGGRIDRSADALCQARLASLWQFPERVRAPKRRRRPPSLGACVPAESATEVTLCTMWGEVLGVHEVGRSDDFFALGGDSLKGTIMLARLEARLGIALPLRTLFELQTVGGLAAHLDAVRWVSQAKVDADEAWEEL